MELMREAWTDERLDDLANRMDRGFEKVDTDIRELRGEVRGEFTALRGEMRDEFSALRSEMQDEFAAVRTEIKDGSTATKGELAAVRTEIKDGSTATKDDFATVRGEFASLREENIAIWGGVNTRLDGIQQTMIRFNGALLVSMVALILAVLLRGA